MALGTGQRHHKMSLFNIFNAFLKDAFTGKPVYLANWKRLCFNEFISSTRKYFYNKKHTSLTKYA